jgi:hypothetical protein
VSESLTVISGVVTELVVRAGEEEFIRSAGEQVVGVGAAAGLAAAGLAGSAAGSSLAAASGGDSVEFFSCNVNGRFVRGCFSKVTFRANEEITLVVSEKHQSLVWAAQRTKDHTMWMAPHCSRGKRAHALFSWLLVVRLLLGLLIAGALFVVLMEYTTASSPFKFLWFDMSLVGATAVTVAPYFAARFYRRWLPIAGQAEHIFTALGYSDPSRVDLPRDHKRYCKAHGIKWPYPSDGPWIYHYLDESISGK